ncbi:hypothetical protein C2F74_RS23245 [Vibrio parahaemolyticus]|nr:hypothetical protein [Vibrio parahaemolyticus]MDF4637912.1 hypothetical protein [Vibrio parahaemolyticus]HBH7880976.1 hypothetical protein [Vibrio parahaemolyticus]
MIEDNQKDRLITQLLRETLSNKIGWSVVEPPRSMVYATDNYVPLYLETNFNNTRLGIYELRFRHFTDYDEYYWSETLGICIVKDHDIVVWKVEEYSPALRELFDLARERASGLGGLLNF